MFVWIVSNQNRIVEVLDIHPGVDGVGGIVQIPAPVSRTLGRKINETHCTVFFHLIGIGSEVNHRFGSWSDHVHAFQNRVTSKTVLAF
jgi:hypothetical protein